MRHWPSHVAVFSLQAHVLYTGHDKEQALCSQTVYLVLVNQHVIMINASVNTLSTVLILEAHVHLKLHLFSVMQNMYVRGGRIINVLTRSK